MWASMIFQLLTPAIAITFALCFFAIYFYDKSKKAPLILAIAYAFGAASLIVDFYRQSMDVNLAPIFTNALYTTTLFLTTTSLAVHFRNKPPLLLMVTICALQGIILAYFIFWEPNIANRTIVANMTAASLMACALLVIPYNDKHFINRLLFWVSAATAIQFALRSFFVFYMVYHLGYALTDANYSQSMIIISLHFSVALLSLIMAVTASIAFGIDAITDIKKMADTDVLSGLLNRRGFELEASKIIELAKAKNTPLVLIVADLDKFKNINDKYGHITGDEVIHTFGKLMRRLCRKEDLAGRMGGEEFCILLNSSDLNMGRLIAGTLRQEISSQEFQKDNEIFSVTASFGISELKHDDTYNSLFSKADEELYKAKNMGRNQVRPKRANFILKSAI